RPSGAAAELDEAGESQNTFLNRGEPRRGAEGGPRGGGGAGRGGGGSRGPRGGRHGDRSRGVHHGVHPGGTRPRTEEDDLLIGAGIPEGAPYSSEEAVRLV